MQTPYHSVFLTALYAIPAGRNVSIVPTAEVLADVVSSVYVRSQYGCVDTCSSVNTMSCPVVCVALDSRLTADRLDRHLCARLSHHAQHKSVGLTTPAGAASYSNSRYRGVLRVKVPYLTLRIWNLNVEIHRTFTRLLVYQSFIAKRTRIVAYCELNCF